MSDIGRNRAKALSAMQAAITTRPATWTPEEVLDAMLESGAVVLAPPRGDDYVCPNGHPFEGVYAVRCDECGAPMAVIPLAVEMELREEVERLRGLLGEATE